MFVVVMNLMNFVTCSSFDIQQSEKDLLNHLPLIREAVQRDKDLAKSKVTEFFFFP